MKSNDEHHNIEGTTVTDTHQVSKKIKEDCLRLLTRREYSRKQIQDKLAVKGYESSQVSSVIDELARQSWQDDARYAESYARVRSQKGFGPIRIAYELRQQGIGAEMVENIVRSSMTENWLDTLKDVYTKKYSKMGAVDNSEKARRIRFLLQRGFSSTMIQDFFKQTNTKST